MRMIPADVHNAAVLRLFSDHDDHMIAFLGPDSGFYTRYSDRECIDRVWLADADGAPAGCIASRAAGEGAWEVKRLFVRPEYRGRGVSKALLAALEAEARRSGCRALTLDTRITLEPAVSLYRASGFAITYREGLYIRMEKPLL